jgi:acyl-lipid omega-6 desaturase (Delta-12 desaturase)
MSHKSNASSEYDGWQTVVARYAKPDAKKATWQVINSFGGFFLGWLLMYLSLQVGYWLTLLLALPTAGFLVRIFIIQHDCGHNSFFKSRRANDLTGVACSLFTLMAYKYWRKGHAVHHAHHAELEERGIGDVWTMTIDEYAAASRWQRIAYRIFRHPLILFGIGPALFFVFAQRLPLAVQENWRNGETASVWWTNLALAVISVSMIMLIGFGSFLAIFVPVIVLASSAGSWLFYVQHQFERTYWEHTPDWDFILAAMHGSSYYKLPRVLQWFTGNIGFHHIHHLSPRIPNYHLEQCHEENPMMQRVVQLTIKDSLKTIPLALWDEERRRLVTIREGMQSIRSSTVSA